MVMIGHVCLAGSKRVSRTLLVPMIFLMIFLAFLTHIDLVL